MERFDGHIMGAAFASGHRIVVGRWFSSPFGGFSDVMWRDPDGRRTLMASDDAASSFITRHYSFEEVRVTPVEIFRSRDHIRVRAERIALDLTLAAPGPASTILRLQPRGLRTNRGWIRVQDTVGRPVLGPLLFGGGSTHLVGRTRAGTREWYAIHDFRRGQGRGALEDRDLGPVGPCPPAGFGFSEFPDGAALTRVTSLFEGSVGE